MLRVASKRDLTDAVPIEAVEDRVLRAAFGRFGGGADARRAAAAVVARYQQADGGHWFLCDCLPGAPRPPVLVPVAETHVRRHEDTRWPVHCASCAFFRDPEEEKVVGASYRRLAVDQPLRLARPLGRTAQPVERGTEACSREARRPGIARLLVDLVTRAGLQSIGRDWRPTSLVDQVKEIWLAARGVELDEGIRLPDFLCTSPGKLPALVAKIEGTRPSRFVRNRPHGILLLRAAAVTAGVLHPIAGEPIPVLGRLAVFGERLRASRGTAVERVARAPYLVACVLGRMSEGGAVGVLSAYAHPCVSDGHLMLVDSDMERRTLAEILRVRIWLQRNAGIGVSIGKPLLDIGPEPCPDDSPRPVCIPDFLVSANRPDGSGCAVVVETMGFADAEYRLDKARTHPLMVEFSGGAEIVLHEFHVPERCPQGLRDDTFWHELRRALIRGVPGASASG